MAVANIDTVYQRVLVLANKEQRGYITPQEFNLLAGKAQNDIFEMYFNDQKTAMLSPGNHNSTLDDADKLSRKISYHRVTGAMLSFGDAQQSSHIDNSPGVPPGAEGYVTVVNYASGTLSTKIDGSWDWDKVHYLESVYEYLGNSLSIYEEVPHDKWMYIRSNKKLSPTSPSRGIWRWVYNTAGGATKWKSIEVFPATTQPTASQIRIDYIKRPDDPRWGYVVVNEKALYNSNTTTGFELHSSEESTLTNKILELAGIVINKPGLSEVILRNEAVKEANENK